MHVLADDRTQDLTVAETAQEIQVHPQTVYRWIAERRIRAYRIGRAVRVPWAELQRLRAGLP